MEIQLTQNKATMVDDADYEWLSKNGWYARNTRGLFYAQRTLRTADGKRHQVLMHREIWKHHHGSIPKGMEIDHINGNPLDNRLENLRLCTHAQNMANERKKAPHSSKYRGVNFNKYKGRWEAKIQSNSKPIHIGTFISETEAAKAYDTMAQELFGNLAQLNLGGKK